MSIYLCLMDCERNVMKLGLIYAEAWNLGKPTHFVIVRWSFFLGRRSRGFVRNPYGNFQNKAGQWSKTYSEMPQLMRILLRFLELEPLATFFLKRIGNKSMIPNSHCFEATYTKYLNANQCGILLTHIVHVLHVMLHFRHGFSMRVNKYNFLCSISNNNVNDR